MQNKAKTNAKPYKTRKDTSQVQQNKAKHRTQPNRSSVGYI